MDKRTLFQLFDPGGVLEPPFPYHLQFSALFKRIEKVLEPVDQQEVVR